LAIIGSTINVSFTSDTIGSARLDLSYFGQGLVNMTKVGNLFSYAYTVTAGNKAGTWTPVVVAYITGNPNPGTADAPE
jgi:hypothetical protein